VFTAVALLTAVVDILNVACVVPGGTLKLAGTVANLGLSLDRETKKPPAGAGTVKLTVATADERPR
jgi:hypothetical protein